MRRVAGIAIALASAITLPEAAAASPLEDTSGAQVFTGAAHPHATSIVLNPAALGLARRGQHFYFGAHTRVNRFKIDRLVLDDSSQNFIAGPSVSETTVSPGGFLGFHTSVGDRGSFGLAVHTPVWEEFISSQRVLSYHVSGGRIWQGAFSLAGAYRASSRFQFGLGLTVGFTRVEFDLHRDTALEAGSDPTRGIGSDCGGLPCGHENPEATQRYSIDVGTPGLGGLFATKNLALSAGMTYRPVGDWQIGVSYVSPPGAITALDLGGDVVVQAAPRDGGGELRGDAEITFEMPQSFQVDFRGPIFTGFNLVGGVRWQNFSKQNQFDIRFVGTDLDTAVDIPEWYPRGRNLADVWRFQAGLEAQESATLRFAGRVRFETGATSATTTTPLQVYGSHIGFATGTEFRVTEALVLSASYDISWFPTLSTTNSDFDPRDRLACVDSEFDFNACRAARDGRATPAAAGTYRRLQHALTFSIRYDLF